MKAFKIENMDAKPRLMHFLSNPVDFDASVKSGGGSVQILDKKAITAG